MDSIVKQECEYFLAYWFLPCCTSMWCVRFRSFSHGPFVASPSLVVLSIYHYISEHSEDVMTLPYIVQSHPTFNYPLYYDSSRCDAPTCSIPVFLSPRVGQWAVPRASKSSPFHPPPAQHKSLPNYRHALVKILHTPHPPAPPAYFFKKKKNLKYMCRVKHPRQK